MSEYRSDGRPELEATRYVMTPLRSSSFTIVVLGAALLCALAIVRARSYAATLRIERYATPQHRSGHLGLLQQGPLQEWDAYYAVSLEQGWLLSASRYTGELRARYRHARRGDTPCTIRVQDPAVERRDGFVVSMPLTSSPQPTEEVLPFAFDACAPDVHRDFEATIARLDRWLSADDAPFTAHVGSPWGNLPQGLAPVAAALAFLGVLRVYRVEVEVDPSTTPATVRARSGFLRPRDRVRLLTSEIAGARVVSHPFGPFVRYHVALATTDGRRIALWPFARFALDRARQDQEALERRLQAVGIGRSPTPT